MEYTAFEILSKLSHKELLRFRRFVHSPYFNKSRKLTKLFDKLVKYHPDFPKDLQVINSLINSESYNSSTVLNLLHDLQCLAQRFIVIDAFENNLPASASGITRFIRKKGQYDVLYKLIKEFESQESLQGTSNIFSLLDFQDEKFNTMAESGRFTGMKIFENLEQLVLRRNALNQMYYTIEYIKTWHIYSNVRKKFMADEVISTEEEDIEKDLKKLMENQYIKEYHELIYIYSELHKFQKEEVTYFEFKAKLQEVIHLLHGDERNYLYGRLIDYITVKSRTDDTFVSEQLKLYEEIFEKEYFKSSVCDHIPPDLWRLAILYGYRLKNHKWLEKIITLYASKLNPALQDNLIIYANAFVLYCKNEYTKVLELVHQVEFNLRSFRIDIKSLMLRCYYETKNYEAAIALLDSFMHTLNKSNIPIPQRKSYRGYMRMVNKMISYRMVKTKTNLKKAELFYLSLGNVHGKEWLKEKFDEIENVKNN